MKDPVLEIKEFIEQKIDSLQKEYSPSSYGDWLLKKYNELLEFVKPRVNSNPTVREFLSCGLIHGDFALVGSYSGKVYHRSWTKKNIPGAILDCKVAGNIYGGNDWYDKIEMRQRVRIRELDALSYDTVGQRICCYVEIPFRDYELAHKGEA